SGQSPPTTVTPTLSNLTVAGSNLFFSLDYSDSTSDSQGDDAQLWTSNGTAAGTVRVVAPASGLPFTSLSDFMPLGNSVLFEVVESSGALELWKSDGTAQGTTRLNLIDPMEYGGYSASAPNTVVSHGVLYFAVKDGSHGNELWEIDGTPGGTFLAADIA